MTSSWTTIWSALSNKPSSIFDGSKYFGWVNSALSTKRSRSVLFSVSAALVVAFAVIVVQFEPPLVEYCQSPFDVSRV